jgi:hypothetical protein
MAYLEDINCDILRFDAQYSVYLLKNSSYDAQFSGQYSTFLVLLENIWLMIGLSSHCMSLH